MTPEFLFFDLGKVLLDFDHPRMCRQMADLCGTSADVLEQLLMPGGGAPGDPLWQLEAGEIEVNPFFEGLVAQVPEEPDREALRIAACDIFSPMPPSIELVRRLRKAGHRLGLLSNTNHAHWEFIFDGRFPELNGLMEVPLASFQLKSMKPAPEIFEAAAERVGVPPGAIFFVDDRPENVAGALASGWDAVQFVSAAQLEADLAERGVVASRPA